MRKRMYFFFASMSSRNKSHTARVSWLKVHTFLRSSQLKLRLKLVIKTIEWEDNNCEGDWQKKTNKSLTYVLTWMTNTRVTPWVTALVISWTRNAKCSNKLLLHFKLSSQINKNINRQFSAMYYKEVWRK